MIPLRPNHISGGETYTANTVYAERNRTYNVVLFRTRWLSAPLDYVVAVILLAGLPCSCGGGGSSAGGGGVSQTQTPDFSISVTPDSATVPSGGALLAQVSIAPLNDFSGSVTVNITGLPIDRAIHLLAVYRGFRLAKHHHQRSGECSSREFQSDSSLVQDLQHRRAWHFKFNLRLLQVSG